MHSADAEFREHNRTRLCSVAQDRHGPSLLSRWWKEPEVLKLLLSEEKSLNQVRAELKEEISTSQVDRLRRQAKCAYRIRNGKPIPTGDGLDQ